MTEPSALARQLVEELLTQPFMKKPAREYKSLAHAYVSRYAQILEYWSAKIQAGCDIDTEVFALRGIVSNIETCVRLRNLEYVLVELEEKGIKPPALPEHCIDLMQRYMAAIEGIIEPLSLEDDLRIEIFAQCPVKIDPNFIEPERPAQIILHLLRVMHRGNRSDAKEVAIRHHVCQMNIGQILRILPDTLRAQVITKVRSEHPFSDNFVKKCLSASSE